MIYKILGLVMIQPLIYAIGCLLCGWGMNDYLRMLFIAVNFNSFMIGLYFLFK